MKFPVALNILLFNVIFLLPAADSESRIVTAPEAKVQFTAETLLGYTLFDLYTGMGIPSSVKVVRGPEVWQDDVVFVFSDGIEVCLCADRVWQVKLSDKSQVECAGLRPGMALPIQLSELPFDVVEQKNGEIIFELKKTSYPVRFSVNIDTTGIIQDMYVYRADY